MRISYRLKYLLLGLGGILSLSFSIFQLEGPGLPKISYREQEIIQPLFTFSGKNGSPEGHSNVFMFKGYLAIIGAKDSGKPGGGFSFYEVKNPRHPKLVFSKYDQETYLLREAHTFGYAQRNGKDYLAFLSVEGIQIWDWTHLKKPKMVQSVSLPGVRPSDYTYGAWWLDWQGDYLFVGGGNNGLFLLNLQDPERPFLSKHWPPHMLGESSVGPVITFGNRMVLTHPGSNSLLSFDISDPLSPQLLSKVELPEAVYSIQFDGRYIYALTRGEGRLIVLELKPDGDIILLGKSEATNNSGGYLTFQDGFIHAGMSNSYVKFDVKDPSTPKIVSKGSSGFPNRDEDFAFVLGNLVFVGNDHGNGSVWMAHSSLPDNAGPVISHIYPFDGAKDQALSTRISISFSDAIDFGSIHKGSIWIREKKGNKIPGAISFQGATLHFQPSELLTPLTKYEIHIPSGGLKDISGNPNDTAFRAEFETGPGKKIAKFTPEILHTPISYKGDSALFELKDNFPAYSHLSFLWQVGEDDFLSSSEPSISLKFTDEGSFPIKVNIVIDSQYYVYQFMHHVVSKPRPHRSITSSPILIDSNRNYLWNVNPDNNSISVSSVKSYRNVKEIPVGNKPTCLAKVGEKEIWVSCRESDEITIIDANSLSVIKKIHLDYGSKPHGILYLEDYDYCFITLAGKGEVISIHTQSRQLERKKYLEPSIQEIAMDPKTKRIWVSPFISSNEGGKVFELSAATLDLLKTYRLQHDPGPDTDISGRGLPNYISSLSLHPNGEDLWVLAQKHNVQRGPILDGKELSFENTVRAMTAVVEVTREEENLAKRLDFDNRNIPKSIVFGPNGLFACIAFQGNNLVEIRNTLTGKRVGAIEDVGFAPQGLVIDPQALQLFVYSYLSRHIQVYDISSFIDGHAHFLPFDGQIQIVKADKTSPEVLQGKRLFFTAQDSRMAKDGYMSCASCHVDEGHDGRTWDFSQFGEGLRNTPDLVGLKNRIGYPLHWTANFDEFQDFENQIRELAGGEGFMSEKDYILTQTPLGYPKAKLSSELDNLSAYLESISDKHRSPFKTIEGKLNEKGSRGKKVFHELKCGTCHGGSEFSSGTNSLLYDVGTLKISSGRREGKELHGLRAPTLRGLWGSAPYLHDGSIETLEELFSDENAINAHVGVQRITHEEREDLIAYLRQLDGNEPGISEEDLYDVKLSDATANGLITKSNYISIEVHTNIPEVTKVSFFVNEKFYQEDVDAPYLLEFPSNEEEDYIVQAKVYFRSGRSSVFSPPTIWGREIEEKQSLSIFPNPSQGQITLHSQSYLLGSMKILVYNSQGSLVYEQTFPKEHMNWFQTISLRELPKGIYVVHAHMGEDNQSAQKVLIK